MLLPKEKLKRWEEAMRDVYGFCRLFGQQNSQEILAIDAKLCARKEEGGVFSHFLRLGCYFP